MQSDKLPDQVRVLYTAYLYTAFRHQLTWCLLLLTATVDNRATCSIRKIFAIFVHANGANKPKPVVQELYHFAPAVRRPFGERASSGRTTSSGDAEGELRTGISTTRGVLRENVRSFNDHRQKKVENEVLAPFCQGKDPFFYLINLLRFPCRKGIHISIAPPIVFRFFFSTIVFIVLYSAILTNNVCE
jgi:hypothetical protein